MAAPLHLAIDGADNAPPVVLLHAILTSGELWRPQLPAWANRFRVIRVDLPGHGDSAPLADGADYADYGAAVVETIASLGIKRAAIVGLSFGAMVAQRIAADHPELVTAMVLANCGAVTPDPVRAMWEHRIVAASQAGLDDQVATTIARWFTPGFASAAPLTLAWVEQMIRASSAEGFIAAARAIQTLDHRSLLGRTSCQTLVVAGSHDQAIAAEVSRAMAAALPNGRLATLDAAHLSNVEQPVAFTETVGAFLVQAVGTGA